MEPSRIDRWLERILSEALGHDGPNLPGAHITVSKAFLANESRQVELRMYPADTLTQARFFYKRPNVVERIPLLKGKGWSVSPNFHFGYWIKGLCWMETTMPLLEYLSYWQQNIRNTNQINRRDWNEYWDKLVKAKIAEPAGRERFDRDFTDTKREFASPRPGLKCTFVWSLDEAERLDARGQLTKDVKERINQLLEALDENKIDAE